MLILLVILVVTLILGGVIYASILERKRREALGQLAASLGMLYQPGRDRAMASRFQFLNKLAQGSNRYAYNLIQGAYRGQQVMLFDYHYETYSTDSKGNRTTTHHHFSFFILRLPARFPELVIAPEGWASKIAQFFGYEDIDFESAEFSRKFVVRSPDKRFAYDFCNPQMIDYLLDNQDLQIEVEFDSLAFFFDRRLAVDAISPSLDRLWEVRQRMPDYLFQSK